jgi:hypothetical protein
MGERELRFFSTITVFDASDELTVAELRIESTFPADEATDEFCRARGRHELARNIRMEAQPATT